MDTRERQIEQIVGLAADAMLYYGWNTNDIADHNSIGWTVELTDWTGTGLVRYEGVVLTPDELDRAIEMAYGFQEA